MYYEHLPTPSNSIFYYDDCCLPCFIYLMTYLMKIKLFWLLCMFIILSWCSKPIVDCYEIYWNRITWAEVLYKEKWSMVISWWIYTIYSWQTMPCDSCSSWASLFQMIEIWTWIAWENVVREYECTYTKPSKKRRKSMIRQSLPAE